MIRPRPQLPPAPPLGLTASEMQAQQRIIAAYARQSCEALNLYRPLIHLESFHASHCREKLVTGANRSSKTLSVMVELARAFTRQDPFHKYPDTGIAYLVALDAKHIGQNFYDKLFRADTFKMIRDLETKEWRTYRPWEEAGRIKEVRPAPPLIPNRFIKSIAWENKKFRQPSLISLTTGWDLYFYTSKGLPTRGTEIDIGAFIEEIENPVWYSEVAVRLAMRNGFFFWDATPQGATDELITLNDRCEKYEEEEPVEEMRPARKWFCPIDANPYLSAEQRATLQAKLSPDDVLTRIYGQFAHTARLIYPTFNLGTHGMKDFEIPRTWTRYEVVDPGFQVCAILFAAVPPDRDQVFLYDEIYQRTCDAETFGRLMAQRCANRPMTQARIIDHHGGRLTDIGSGKSVEQQYSDALRRHNVPSVSSGFGFIWGSDDVKGGIEAVRDWLRVRADGTTKLKVFPAATRHLQSEFKRYHNMRGKDGELIDKPVARKFHLMDDLRYLAQYNPKWVPPRPHEPEKSGAVKYFEAKMKRKANKRGGEEFVRLGPPGDGS